MVHEHFLFIVSTSDNNSFHTDVQQIFQMQSFHGLPKFRQTQFLNTKKKKNKCHNKLSSTRA